jgi:hypothetical protein
MKAAIYDAAGKICGEVRTNRRQVKKKEWHADRPQIDRPSQAQPFMWMGDAMVPLPESPRVSDRPRPGCYLLRLVRGGPRVGAQIMQQSDGMWMVMIDGEWQGPALDPWTLPMMERVHFYGRETTPEEAAFRVGVKRWAEIYRPNHPAANPRKPIDPGDMEVVF